MIKLYIYTIIIFFIWVDCLSQTLYKDSSAADRKVSFYKGTKDNQQLLREIYYNENGNMQRELIYLGSFGYIQYVWFPNGQIRSYHYNVPQGCIERKEWTESGVLFLEEVGSSLKRYDQINGKLVERITCDGVKEKWYPNGNKWTYSNIKVIEGKENGIRISWNINGEYQSVSIGYNNHWEDYYAEHNLDSIASNYNKTSYYKDPIHDKIVKHNGFVYIPSGILQRSYNCDSIMVNSFFIYKNEVTNKEYRSFLNSLKNNIYNPEYPIENFCVFLPDTTLSIIVNGRSINASEYFNNIIFDDYPVMGVDYYSATEYCRYLRVQLKNVLKINEDKINFECRLPTEVEWLYAAMMVKKNSLASISKKNQDRHLNELFPVHKATKNKIGVKGMYGNVSEWVFDSYIKTRFDSIHLDYQMNVINNRYYYRSNLNNSVVMGRNYLSNLKNKTLIPIGFQLKDKRFWTNSEDISTRILGFRPVFQYITANQSWGCGCDCEWNSF